MIVPIDLFVGTKNVNGQNESNYSNAQWWPDGCGKEGRSPGWHFTAVTFEGQNLKKSSNPNLVDDLCQN